MKVAIAQVQSSTNKEENLQKAKKYITEASAKGADFVVFPELFMAFVSADGQRPVDVAESLEENFVTQISEYAKENQVYVVFGMFEKIEGDSERAFNTTVLLDRSGNILQSYRKTHLYDAFSFKESDTILASDNEIKVADTEFGKIGLMVCYEVRFPEISRKLAMEGADYLFIPAGWVAGAMKEDHYQTLLRARAIENTAFVFSPNQVGNIYTGRSVMIDPMGVILAEANEEETLIFTEVDTDRVNRVREKLPSVADRKPSLY